MPDAYTPRLRITEPEVGGHPDAWGGVLNQQALRLLDDAIAGLVQIDLGGGDVTLTALNGAPDQSRMAVLEFYGATGPSTVTVPAINKLYFVRNTSTHALTITTGTGATVELAAETASWVHATMGGPVYPAAIPIDISAGGTGGIEVAGRFATPGFEDVGDLAARMVRLSDASGLEINSGQTDKPVSLVTESNVEILRIVTEDAGAAENASIVVGSPATHFTVLGDLELSSASGTNLLRLGGRTESLVILASGGISEAGSSIVLIGDQEATTPAARGNVELVASTQTGISPTVNINGFSGGVLVDGETVWHGGNQGAGSGLDADQLDGHEGAAYLRLTDIANQVAAGAVTFQSRVIATRDFDAISIEAQLPELKIERLDGDESSLQVWRFGVGGTSDGRNLLVSSGGARNVTLELDRAEDLLYRGAKSNNDPYVTAKSGYLDTNGGASGYVKIGSIYLQYGVASVSANTFANVTLPTGFPTACRTVSLTDQNTGVDSDSNLRYSVLSPTQIRIHNSGPQARTVGWLAIGD